MKNLVKSFSLETIKEELECGKTPLIIAKVDCNSPLWMIFLAEKQQDCCLHSASYRAIDTEDVVSIEVKPLNKDCKITVWESEYMGDYNDGDIIDIPVTIPVDFPPTSEEKAIGEQWHYDSRRYHMY